MATITWTGKYNRVSFDKAGNWDSDTVPGSSDYVRIGRDSFGLYEPVTSRMSETIAGLYVAPDSVLSISGLADAAPTFEIVNAYVSSKVAGQISVGNATLLAQGTILGGSSYHPWNIALSGAGGIGYYPGLLEVGANGLELSNTLLVRMYGGAIDTSTADASLYLSGSSRIYGAGNLGFGTRLAVFNGPSGSIIGAAGNLYIDNAGASFVNEGLIESTYNGFQGNGFGVTLSNAKVRNVGGTLEATSVPSGFDTEFGLRSTTIYGGTLKTVGLGTFQVLDNAVVLDGLLHAVTNAGTVDFGGHTLTMRGTILDYGAIQSPGSLASELLLTASTTLYGAGRIALSDDFSNRITAASASERLVSTDTISGAGDITGLILVNSGVIEATGAKYPLFIASPNVTNYDVLAATGAAGMALVSANVTQNGGGLYAGAGSILDIESTTVRGSGASTSEADTAKGGTIRIDNGSVVQLQGPSSNSGVISLNSTGALTDLRVLAAGATLAGGGTVTLGGPKARVFGSVITATLTNADNTISGSGWLGLAELTLDNQAKGVIEAVGAQGLVVNTSGVTSVNAGLIESAAGSALTLQNSTLDQSAGGNIEALAGGRVYLSNDVIAGGTLLQVGTGVIDVNVSGGELNGAASQVTMGGVVQLLNGVVLTLEGTLRNVGKLNTFASTSTTALIVGAAGATLTGGGQINLNANTRNLIMGAAPADTLTNLDNRIAGAGQIGGGSLTLINTSGIIAGTTSLSLTIDTGTNTVTNGGAIESLGTGPVVVKSAIANTGLLFAVAGTLSLAGAVSGTGIAQIKSGVLDIAAKFAQSVIFVTGATGQLRLTDSKDFTGTVRGLSTSGGNSIDLPGVAFSGGVTKATFSGTTASGVLTVTNGTASAHIALVGNYLGHTFITASDGHGGTKITDPPAATALAQAMAAAAPPAPTSFHSAPTERLPPLVTLVRTA